MTSLYVNLYYKIDGKSLNKIIDYIEKKFERYKISYNSETKIAKIKIKVNTIDDIRNFINETKIKPDKIDTNIPEIIEELANISDEDIEKFEIEIKESEGINYDDIKQEQIRTITNELKEKGFNVIVNNNILIAKGKLSCYNIEINIDISDSFAFDYEFSSLLSMTPYNLAQELIKQLEYHNSIECDDIIKFTIKYEFLDAIITGEIVGKGRKFRYEYLDGGSIENFDFY